MKKWRKKGERREKERLEGGQRKEQKTDRVDNAAADPDTVSWRVLLLRCSFSCGRRADHDQAEIRGSDLAEGVYVSTLMKSGEFVRPEASSTQTYVPSASTACAPEDK